MILSVDILVFYKVVFLLLHIIFSYYLLNYQVFMDQYFAKNVQLLLSLFSIYLNAVSTFSYTLSCNINHRFFISAISGNLHGHFFFNMKFRTFFEFYNQF